MSRHLDKTAKLYRFQGAVYREAAKLVMYHGTATGSDEETLRRILKEGLLANPKDRRYVPPKELDETDVTQVREVEYVTYGGVYLASDLVTALKYAQGAHSQIGGDLVVVTAQVETRSPEVTIDEDQFLTTVSIRLFSKAIKRAVEQATGKDITFGQDVYKAVEDGSIDLGNHIEQFLQELLKKKPLTVSIEKLLRYKTEFTALLRLAFEFEAATGFRKEEGRDPKEIAADFRAGANGLYRRISGLGDPVPGRNIRSFDTITYRGANRILSVLVLSPDGRQGRVAYSGDGTTTNKVAAQIEVILGTQIRWGVETSRHYDDVAEWTATALEAADNQMQNNDIPECDNYDVDEDLCVEAQELWTDYADEHSDAVLERARVVLHEKILQLQREVERCGGEDALEFLSDNWDYFVQGGWADEEDPSGCVDPEEVHGLINEVVFDVKSELFGNLLDELDGVEQQVAVRTALTPQQKQLKRQYLQQEGLKIQMEHDRFPSFEEVWKELEDSDSVAHCMESHGEDFSEPSDEEVLAWLEQKGVGAGKEPSRADVDAHDTWQDRWDDLVEQYRGEVYEALGYLWATERAKEDVKERYDDAVDRIKFDLDEEDCWRAITLPVSIDPAEHPTLGTDWAYEQEGAGVYHSGPRTKVQKQKVQYCARIDTRYIDKLDTILVNTDLDLGDIEKEVRFYQGAPIWVYGVELPDGTTVEINDWRTT